MLLILLFSCSDRNRDNIFDPQNTDNKIDLNFTITQAESGFTLKWNLSNYNDIDSIIIYKSNHLRDWTRTEAINDVKEEIGVIYNHLPE